MFPLCTDPASPLPPGTFMSASQHKVTQRASDLAAVGGHPYRERVSAEKVNERGRQVKQQALRLWEGIGPRRLLLATLVGTLAAVIWTAMVWAPTRLVETDLEDKSKRVLSPAELLKAKNDVRTTLLQGVAGGFLLVGLYFTYRTIQVNREGQITERFTRAIDQLGSGELDVRLGGIYALERVAKDSKSDHGPVMEVLMAFLREHSRREREADKTDRQTGVAASDRSEERARADLQAAATVIGRRKARNDPPGRLLDLSRAWLPKARLRGSSLQGAYFGGANLQEAYLRDANLQEAYLHRANLQEARLDSANLKGAFLQGANLRGAFLGGANLQGADLGDANLQEAHLDFAKLKGATLHRANLQRAMSLNREQLEEAYIDETTRGVPPEFRD